MDFKQNLADLKLEIDKQIELYLNVIIKEVSSRDRFVADSLQVVKKSILSGGKRIRPALMYWGYLGAGGKEKEKIIKASIGIELIHAFLLIHDDIMDRDLIRHGKPTINAVYQKFGQKNFKEKDAEHFGNSMAIIVGDMIGALGNQVIFESKFPPDLIMRALSKLQDIVSLTVIGQAKDINMEYFGRADEDDVLQMYEYKTAKYTLEGPLHLGGILGEAKPEILESYSSLSIPLGIAFQIQDDILGIFGTEKIIGKTIGSDIAEGKQTILVIKALERGSRSECKRIKELLGKQNITKQEVEEFKNILIQTGSLDYAKELAKNLIVKGKKEIKMAMVEKNAKDFLLDLAEYLVSRDY